MAKVLVIPDVHLKPWMFDRADEIKDDYDMVVLLGDLVDDFGKQNNLNLYEETLDRVVEFIKSHKNVVWCRGNHDMSYKWKYNETGYSPMAVSIVNAGLSKIERALNNIGYYIYRKDNVLFSHGGLTKYFVFRFCKGLSDIDDIVNHINNMPREKICNDESPIWARPQYGLTLYDDGFLQVVGHTPMEDITLVGNCLSCDVFSTHPDGSKYGSEKFVIVDTIEKSYVVAK